MSDHQVAADAVMAELWFNLARAPRRALCEIAHLDPAIGNGWEWKVLPVDQRVRLVRAMSTLADVTIDCATALEAVRAKLESTRASN